MKADVFISYSSKDKAIADAMVHFLEARKIRCWIAPRDISGGKDYADSIVEALQSIEAVIFVYSKHSLGSRWCKSEVDTAVGYGKTIVPFKIDETNVCGGWRLYLATKHWIDAVPEPEKMFDKIASDLSKMLGLGESSDQEIHAPQEKVTSREVNGKDDIRTRIEDALRPLLSDDSFYMGSIPPKKLENACRSMKVTEPYSDVVAIYDGTVFGSAKEGMAITTKGAYFNYSGQFSVVWGADTVFEKGDADTDIIVGTRKTTLIGLNKAGQEVLINALRVIDAGAKHCEVSEVKMNDLALGAGSGFKQLIVEELSKISASGVFVDGAIPPTKKHNAITSMGVREDVIVLMDGTVWGSAKEGIVITDKAIYYKNLWQDAHRCKWGTTLMVAMNNDGDDIVINGDEVVLAGVAENGIKKRIVDAIIKINDNANEGGDARIAKKPKASRRKKCLRESTMNAYGNS